MASDHRTSIRITVPLLVEPAVHTHAWPQLDRRVRLVINTNAANVEIAAPRRSSCCRDRLKRRSHRPVPRIGSPLTIDERCPAGIFKNSDDDVVSGNTIGSRDFECKCQRCNVIRCDCHGFGPAQTANAGRCVGAVDLRPAHRSVRRARGQVSGNEPELAAPVHSKIRTRVGIRNDRYDRNGHRGFDQGCRWIRR
ncbi:MAG: hypothetical protein QNL98_11625 [Mycobacterium sp.]